MADEATTSQTEVIGEPLQVKPKMRPVNPLARPLPKGATTRISLLVMADRSMEITIEGGEGFSVGIFEENLWAIYAMIEENAMKLAREQRAKEKNSAA